jgi:hypothetical protein
VKSEKAHAHPGSAARFELTARRLAHKAFMFAIQTALFHDKAGAFALRASGFSSQAGGSWVSQTRGPGAQI